MEYIFLNYFLRSVNEWHALQALETQHVIQVIQKSSGSGIIFLCQNSFYNIITVRYVSRIMPIISTHYLYFLSTILQIGYLLLSFYVNEKTDIYGVRCLDKDNT